MDAAAFADAQIAAVRDDPAGRLALARSIYEDPTGRRSERPRFRRAALAFTHWMAARGVLDALDGTRPGSRWWRAMNERLLHDSCEAFGSATGRGGAPSTDTVGHWTAFIDRPTGQTWYRAHNASIVAAYLEHRDLAADENRVERFFLNVVLSRVLYAHALVERPGSHSASSPDAAPSSATHAAARSTSSSGSGASFRTTTPPRTSSRTTSSSNTGSAACSTTPWSSRACDPSTTGRPENSTDQSSPTSSSTAAPDTPGDRTIEPGPRRHSPSARER